MDPSSGSSSNQTLGTSKRKTSISGPFALFSGFQDKDRRKSSPVIISTTAVTDPSARETILRNIRKVLPGQPQEIRLLYTRDLADAIKTQRVDDGQLLRKAWEAVRDLLQTGRSTDSQNAAYLVLKAIMETYADGIEALRLEFIHAIKMAKDDAVHWKFDAFQLVTREFREVHPFEREISSIIIAWLGEEQKYLPTVMYLAERVAKFSFISFDEPSRINLIRVVCELCDAASSPQVIERAIIIFDTIVTYGGNIPSSCLGSLIGSLCRTVNIESFCKISWQTMQTLLDERNSVGNQGIRALCSILDNPANRPLVNLMRGAVFFLSARCQLDFVFVYYIANVQPCGSILPSLQNALRSSQPIVAYEVALAIRRLVKKYGPKLRFEWDAVCGIATTLHSYLDSDLDSSLVHVIREIIACIDDVHQKKVFGGDEDVLFSMMGLYTPYVHESTALYMLEKMCEDITPIRDDWIEQLRRLIFSFYLSIDSSPIIKERVVSVLRSTFDAFGNVYGDDLLDSVFMPFFQTCYQETSLELAPSSILELLVLVARRTPFSEKFTNLVEMISSLIASPSVAPEGKQQLARGLVETFGEVFTDKNYLKPLAVLEQLLPLLSHQDNLVRLQAVTTLSDLAGTARYTVRLGDRMSPFLRLQPSKRPGAALFPMQSVFDALVERLRKEDRSEIYLSVVECLMKYLQNRWLLTQVDTSSFVTLLCRLLDNRIFGTTAGSFPISDTQRIALVAKGYQLLCLCIPDLSSQMILAEQFNVVNCFVSGMARRWPGPEDAWHRLMQTCTNGLCLAMCEVPEALAPAVLKVVSILYRVCQTTDNRGLLIYVLQAHFCIVKTAALHTKVLVSSSGLNQTLDTLILFTDVSRISPPLASMAYQSRVMLNITHNQCKISEAYMDTLSRVAFNNCEPTPPALDNDSVLFKDCEVQSWVQGNSLVSVRTTTHGWAQVCVRTATSSMNWLMRLQNTLKHFGQTGAEGELTQALPEDYFKHFRDLAQSIHLEMPPAPLFQSSSFEAGLSELSATREDLSQAETDGDSDLVEADMDLSLIATSKSMVDVTVSAEKGPNEDEDSPLERALFSPLPRSPVTSEPSPLDVSSATSIADPIPRTKSQTQFKSMLSPPSISDSPRLDGDDVVVPLSAFYPPLPSYEEGGEDSNGRSPSFFPQVDKSIEIQDIRLDVHRGQMSVDAQIYLHSTSQGSDPTTSEGETDVSSQPSSTPKLLIPSIRIKTPDRKLSREKLSPTVDTDSTPPSASRVLFGNDETASQVKHDLDMTAHQPTLPVIPERQEPPPSPVPGHQPVHDATSLQRPLTPGLPSSTIRRSTSAADVPSPTKPRASAERLTQSQKKVPKSSTLPSNFDQEIRERRRRKSIHATASALDQQHSDIDKAIEEFVRVDARASPPYSPSGSRTSSFGDQLDLPAVAELGQPALHPSLVFFQLQRIPWMNSRPQLLKPSEALDRAINVLDRATMYETHKIGIVYIAHGQLKPEEYLSNTYGSPKYTEFLRELGNVVALKDAAFYTAGLDRENDGDGKYSILYKDDTSHVMFHVATMMPCSETDPNMTNKQRHIGNDFVVIVWADLDVLPPLEAIAGQFNFVTIAIQPLEAGFYRVQVRSNLDDPQGLLTSLGPAFSTQVVSEAALASIVRKTALQHNVAAKFALFRDKSFSYASNAEERLRQIKTIAERFRADDSEPEALPPPSPSQISLVGGPGEAEPESVINSSNKLMAPARAGSLRKSGGDT